MSKSSKGASTRRAKATDSSKGEESDSLSFEGALEQLESTVGRLEEGEMPLEEALELFEKGVALSRQCTTTLEAAEKRIEILVADREGDDPEDAWASEPFETDDEDEYSDERAD